VDSAKLYPRTALVLLTSLNLLNYVDRSVLFAVQPLVQSEFSLSNTQVGYLTSAFLLFYMVAAPFVGPLADRYSRKKIIVGGAIFWSGLTLLTAVTHTYTELLIRHTLVGIGEATFVTIAPTFVADLFPEEKRGRILGVFYLAIPVGTAAGYLLGGHLSPHYGWRFPFYIAAVPGFLLALAVLFLREPKRGQFDLEQETPERGTLIGLARNPAFWTSTLGMAMMTFALGGIQVWMPTFLSRSRGYSLESANFMFGIIIVIDGILASLAGGLAGRLFAATNEGRVLLRLCREHGARCAFYDRRVIYARSGDGAGHRGGRIFSPAQHFAFKCGGHQFRERKHPCHRNRRQHFRFSLAGRRSFANSDGLRRRQAHPASRLRPARARHDRLGCNPVLWHEIRTPTDKASTGMTYFHWIAGTILALAWFSRIVDAALGMPSVADISRPEWDRHPGAAAMLAPRVSIIVPARNEEADIEPSLTRLLALDYDNYEVIAVDDRSTDRTGEIMERVAVSHPSASSGQAFSQKTREVGHSHSCPMLRVIHHEELPAGWLGKDPRHVDGHESSDRGLDSIHRRRRFVQARFAPPRHRLRRS
jgi:multidrug resistance protein